MVQLGGLEPPTSCSTDRRSNQLSYNCILGRPPKKGSPNRAETRCNASLWQGRRGHHNRHPRALKRLPQNNKPGLNRPGFFWNEFDRAAGLTSFDALALIGSTFCVATFWLNSASSLAWAVYASNCLR